MLNRNLEHNFWQFEDQYTQFEKRQICFWSEDATLFEYSTCTNSSLYFRDFYFWMCVTYKFLIIFLAWQLWQSWSALTSNVKVYIICCLWLVLLVDACIFNQYLNFFALTMTPCRQCQTWSDSYTSDPALS